MDALQQNVPIFYCCCRRLLCLPCCDQSQKSISCCRCYFELTPLRSCVRFVSGSASCFYIGVAQAEIKGLPADEQTCCTAPYGATVIGANYGAGHRRKGALWKHGPENVIASCTVDLHQSIRAWKVSRSRKTDVGCRRVELFLCDMNQRIIAQRRLHHLRYGYCANRDG